MTKYILKIAIIISVITGIFLQVLAPSLSFMGGKESLLLYYTNQSNIWIIIPSVILIIYYIKKKDIPNWLYTLKYIFVVALLITYTVFNLMLAPALPFSYLTSPENIFLHTVVPILTMMDFLINDKFIPKKKTWLLGLTTPLYYVIFAYIAYGLGASFGNQEFPYFFLDFKANGWFLITETSIGVVYWMILVLGFVVLLSITTQKLITIKNKILPFIVLSLMVMIPLIMMIIIA